MKLSPETLKAIEADIQKEVDQQIKDYPIYVVIDGQEMDIESIDKSGGEITIYLGHPLFCGGRNQYFKLVETDEFQEE